MSPQTKFLEPPSLLSFISIQKENVGIELYVSLSLSSARLLEERKEFDGAVCSIGLICLRQQPHHVKGFAN